MTQPPAPPTHALPPPFNHSTEPFHLAAQGAESLLYRTTSFLDPSQSLALKVRPAKKWRHPALDRRLTRGRILAEARVLVKLARELGSEGDDGLRGGGSHGAAVPAVLALDWENGWLAMEWVEGCSVKVGIAEWEAQAGDGAGDGPEELSGLLKRMGRLVGRLHACGVVHGDLTTSNMMLRRVSATRASDVSPPERNALRGELVLIDFGLAQQSVSDEDRAVDLYVLERAFGSTHPRQESRFGAVWTGYAEAMGKGGKAVLTKLEDVRMRGRKKSMIG